MLERNGGTAGAAARCAPINRPIIGLPSPRHLRWTLSKTVSRLLPLTLLLFEIKVIISSLINVYRKEMVVSVGLYTCHR